MPNSNLPHELLLKIFTDIPRKTLFQCLFVCKSWHKSAFDLYFEHISLCGRQDDVKMLRQMLETDASCWKRNSIRKLDVRLLRDVRYLQNSNGTDDFIAILNACTRLQEIWFGSNVYLLKAMYTSKVLHNDFSHLQKISVDKSSDTSLNRFYHHLVARYRKTITSLYFHLTKTNLTQKPINGNLGMFLSTFPHLKRLGMYYQPTVFVSHIVYFCPQLEYLEILEKKVHYLIRVNTYDPKNAHKLRRQLPGRNVQLKHINILSGQFSQDLCDLLYNYCPHLQQISFFGGMTNEVIESWTLAVKHSTTPPHDSTVESIKFGWSNLDHNKRFQPLASCFPALKELDLGNCRSHSDLSGEDYQCRVDLRNTNLERLKMDISSTFQGSLEYGFKRFKRVIIEVLYDTAPDRYFCREGDFCSFKRFNEIDVETKNAYMAESPTPDYDRPLYNGRPSNSLYTGSITIQANAAFSTIIIYRSDNSWWRRDLSNEEHTNQTISLLVS